MRRSGYGSSCTSTNIGVLQAYCCIGTAFVDRQKELLVPTLRPQSPKFSMKSVCVDLLEAAGEAQCFGV